MACPGNSLRWNVNKEDFPQLADELIAGTKAAFDAVGALTKDQVTYENVIKVLADNEAGSSASIRVLTFPQHVSPDKDLRDASVAAGKKLAEFNVEMSMRQDVFDNLLAVQDKLGDDVTTEAKRYLERMIKFGRRNGLHLPKETQDQIKEIKKRMSDLSIDFRRNLNEEITTFDMTGQQLVGLPEDFLNRLEKTDSGLYKVTLKYPHYFPCMKFVRDPNTRKKLEQAFSSRCIKENTAILEELVQLRHKKASLLGFPTHAAFMLDMRMAKTPETVATFLEELSVKLRALQEEEMTWFLKIKQQECAKYGYTDDAQINCWDLRYYMTRVEEEKYSVDQNKLKEYFPMETVTKGLLKIYQELLSLRFEEIPGAEVWHDEVTLYSVCDRDSSEMLGYFYLDLYPRPGKYGHAACFGLQNGCLGADGNRQVAVAAMVANFTKPTPEVPSLMTHDEVRTYFHEFGHVMHQICARANFALFSGTSVERDFVEAPSQMLENWIWEPESLNRMSAHYKDGSKIAEDLLEKLIQSRNANAGVFNQRQIVLGTFDQTIHKSDQADTAAVLDRCNREILRIPISPGTNMAASFGHLAGGYDAQYYGYLWSQVFSADMFRSRFKKDGIMSPEVGMDYRKYILQPGGTLDAADMLRNFLGREPQQEAFLEGLGLDGC